MEFADFPVDAYLFPRNDFFSLGGEKFSSTTNFRESVFFFYSPLPPRLALQWICLFSCYYVDMRLQQSVSEVMGGRNAIIFSNDGHKTHLLPPPKDLLFSQQSSSASHLQFLSHLLSILSSYQKVCISFAVRRCPIFTTVNPVWS